MRSKLMENVYISIYIEEPNGVTTHLPNGLALKMDGAEASDLNSTISVNAKH